MEIRVICDCSECSSRLIEIGGVNILCNLPTKLLRQCDTELSRSLYCDSDNSCSETLYSKLLCLDIHIIIATTPQGLDGIETLRAFYDLASTHIVCTRPVYTIASLALPKRRYDFLDAAIPCNSDRQGNTKCSPKSREDNTAVQRKDYPQAFSVAVIAEAIRSGHYGYLNPDGQSLDHETDDMQIGESDESINASENVELNSKVSAHSAVETEAEKALGWLNTRSNYLKNKEFLEEINSGGSFWPTRSSKTEKEQPYLKHPDLPYSQRLHAISYNEIVSLEITHAGGPALCTDDAQLSKTDTLLGRSLLRFTSNIELCGFSSGFGLGSTNWLIKHTDSHTSVAVVGETGEVDHERFCTPVDISFIDQAALVVLLDNAASTCNVPMQVKIENPIKREIKTEENDSVKTRLDDLCQMAIQGMQNPEGVVVVTDPYANTLLDILEHMDGHIVQYIKQYRHMYVYVFGEGMADLLTYADKCAEWVTMSRADNTMHHESPSSPFQVISQMKEENRLFVGNSADEIKDVYRFPSVVIVPYDSSTMPYLKGRIYAGANIITTYERCKDELLDMASEMGVKPSLTATELDFRIQPENLIRLLGTRSKLVVSSRMENWLPRSLSLLVGDVIAMPAGIETGLLHADIKKADIECLASPEKVVGDGVVAAAINVKIPNTDSIEIREATLNGDEGKFTFGTFTVDQLLEQLARHGLGGFKATHQTDGYPLEIVGDDHTVILLESPNETCIETASEEKREKIMQVLEQLLTAL
ncbi:hypothetical protein X943_003505 [Babesia divergens]|uniref:Uncharacterized protein n=1 Tax=Babesia divergens TaxID=32595 RepID=A0AAD9LI72_BABDI|nr:hypothetical protein X943_003505 [Babesia divergens]